MASTRWITEDGDFMITEDGDFLIFETEVTPIPPTPPWVPPTPFLPWGPNATFAAGSGHTTFRVEPGKNQNFSDVAGGFKRFPSEDSDS
jgi:hypothetical protein